MGIRVDGAAATTSTATKTSLETEVSSRCFKLHHAYFISFNSTMLANSSGLEFLRTVSKTRRIKRKSLSGVPVLHKT